MKKIVGLLAVTLAVVFAVGFVLDQSSATTASAKVNNQIQLDLIVAIPTGGTVPTPDEPGPVESTLGVIKAALSDHNFQVDSFFDVYYVSNIGSSGEDGVSIKAGANFDVFFEVEISRSGTFDTEMIALSLSSTVPDPTNPQGAIDIARTAVEGLKGSVHYGHVTVLK